jgi:hypothetical protein
LASRKKMGRKKEGFDGEKEKSWERNRQANAKRRAPVCIQRNSKRSKYTGEFNVRLLEDYHFPG